MFTRESSDFINPRFQFIEPLELKYENIGDGVDYFYTKVFYGVFRPSKNKFETCSIKLKIGFNQALKIVHYQEVGLENLKFSEVDNYNSELPKSVNETETWVVILGTFQNESEASEIMQKCNNLGVAVELLSTNNFQYLAKNFYFLCAGKYLTQSDAKELSNEIKLKGFDNYIKNAGIIN